MKYRKKPVVIEAVKWTGENLDEIKSFIGEDSHFHTVSSKMVTSTGRIETEEQLLGSDKLSRLAHIGDYIIKHSDGEYGIRKPDIFEKTYESVEDVEKTYPYYEGVLMDLQDALDDVEHGREESWNDGRLASAIGHGIDAINKLRGNV